jgi:hypothetical protein
MLGTALLIVAGTAGAAASQVDIALNIGASTRPNPRTLIPNGETTTVTSRNFYAFVSIDLITPTPGGRPKVRVELGGGLRWGADDPDPADLCTSTPTIGECQTPELVPITGQSGGGWFWDVVAPGNGTYTLSAAIVEAAEPDPDPSNNRSSITIVVNESAGGGSGEGGSGGGGGGSASISASAVKLSPAKPRAGSTLVASVRVTRGGSPVKPTGVACAATVGKTKIRGGVRSSSGVASCLFKTPKSGKGKTMVGSVSFRAGGQSFQRRFVSRLG